MGPQAPSCGTTGFLSQHVSKVCSRGSAKLAAEYVESLTMMLKRCRGAVAVSDGKQKDFEQGIDDAAGAAALKPVLVPPVPPQPPQPHPPQPPPQQQQQQQEVKQTRREELGNHDDGEAGGVRPGQEISIIDS